MSKIRSRKARRSRGSNIVEFCACLIVIFFMLIIPLIDLGTFITRWGTGSQVVSAWAASIAKERKLSTAFLRVSEGDEFSDAVKTPTGITVTDVQPSLIIGRVNDPSDTIEVLGPGKIPKRWLPNAGQFTYTVRLAVEADVDPLVTITFFGINVPGLTGKTHIKMVGESNWENLGRDPASKEFFINE
ncbi:MAG: hypothetical protein K2Z81_23775 [Cyanobacteria bacterium]|nr:hypothetical protein [Cyanobacteriota bacterium]